MLDFHPIELSDREWIDPLLRLSDFNTGEYTFVNNYIWRMVYHFECARFQDFCILKTDAYGLSFVYPAGSGDLDALVAELRAYCEAAGQPLILQCVPERLLPELESRYPGQFDTVTNRDDYDYLYNTEDLITLKGKKYHSKRNFINRFTEGDWKFEPITPNNIAECAAMNKEWCLQNGCADNEGMLHEQDAVMQSLKHFFELRLQGALLRLDGRVVAFTIGEPLNSNTYIIHIEKAFNDVAGAYPTINREFAEYAAKDYAFINREEDTGDEGLRKAKLSYQPVDLLKKYTVKFR